MSKNSDTKVAYSMGTLNGALLYEEGTMLFLDNATGKSSKVDGYLFSQFRALKPEIKELTYTGEAELREQLFRETTEQEALQEALELMDKSFSSSYRRSTSEFLIRKLKLYPGLTDFLANRLYSTKLPSSFDPDAAIEVIHEQSKHLTDIFYDLRIKSKLFDQFYTKFRLRLDTNDNEQREIDSTLTLNGAFAHFTISLYSQSKSVYDYAVSLAVSAMEKSFPQIDSNLFEDIRGQILANYKYESFYRERSRVPHCTRMLLNVEKHNFFGSELQIAFNCLDSNLPFESEEYINLISKNIVSIYNIERPRTFKHLLSKTVNDFYFLSNIEAVGEIKDDFFTAWNQPDRTSIKNKLRQIFRGRKDVKSYLHLLDADASFICHNFEDAAVKYSRLFVSNQLSNLKTEELPILEYVWTVSNIGIRLGKSYELSNDNAAAVDVYKQIHRQMSEILEIAVVKQSSETLSEFQNLEVELFAKAFMEIVDSEASYLGSLENDVKDSDSL